MRLYPMNKYFCQRYQPKGATLLELVVVVAIIVVLYTVAIPYFTRAKNNLTLKSVTRDIASFLLMAKSKSIKGSKISVDLSDAQKIEICEGNTGYCDTAEQILEIPDDIQFESNLDAFYFERGFPKRPGGPFAAGTITLRHTKTDKCFNITISKTGRIKINACE